LTGLPHQKPNQPGGQDGGDLIEPLGGGHTVRVERVRTSEHARDSDVAQARRTAETGAQGDDARMKLQVRVAA
jgi:hypothetical protein